MQRAPYLVAAGLVGAAVALAVGVAADPEPFASDAAALVVLGPLVFSLITAVGLLLSRGRWSLRLGWGVAASELMLAAVVAFGPAAVVAALLAAASLFGMTGPWLRGWLRGRPAAGGPGTVPMLLVLGSLALVPGSGLASPAGLRWQHWALAGFALAASWGYSRASLIALWGLRVPLVVVLAPAVAASPPAGAAYLAVHGAAVIALAWKRESMRAIRPLLERVYGARAPRRLDPRARGES